MENVNKGSINKNNEVLRLWSEMKNAGMKVSEPSFLGGKNITAFLVEIDGYVVIIKDSTYCGPDEEAIHVVLEHPKLLYIEIIDISKKNFKVLKKAAPDEETAEIIEKLESVIRKCELTQLQMLHNRFIGIRKNRLEQRKKLKMFIA